MLMRALFLIFTAISAVAPDAADHLEAKLVGAGGHYMWVDEEGRVSLWEETNGIPGLQVSPTAEREGAPVRDADTRILA
jgi:hypothetical protein